MRKFLGMEFYPSSVAHQSYVCSRSFEDKFNIHSGTGTPKIMQKTETLFHQNRTTICVPNEMPSTTDPIIVEEKMELENEPKSRKRELNHLDDQSCNSIAKRQRTFL